MSEERTLRVAGFAITAAGALLAGAGSILVWTTVGLREDVQGVLDLEFRGLDLAEGVAVLVLSVLALLTLVVLRRVEGAARIRLAAVLIALGIALVALPAWTIVRAEDRAIEEMAGVLGDATGMTHDEAVDLVRTQSDLAVDVSASGPWVSLTGGLVVVVGAVASMAWARRTTMPARTT